MQRSISGFHQDDAGDWVAELDCGHNQHVRHRPPFQDRPWVVDEAGRASRLGAPLDCPLCERAELPDGLLFARRSAEWDAVSLPAGLRRAHRLASGTWGRLVVEEGRLAFRARTNPPIERELEPGAVQAIPPGVEHEVEPDDDARLFIEFLQVVPYREGRRPSGSEPDVGGDPACWAHLLCEACGRPLSDGHADDCPLADERR